jgi:hypothetical protein
MHQTPKANRTIFIYKYYVHIYYIHIYTYIYIPYTWHNIMYRNICVHTRFMRKEDHFLCVYKQCVWFVASICTYHTPDIISYIYIYYIHMYIYVYMYVYTFYASGPRRWEHGGPFPACIQQCVWFFASICTYHTPDIISHTYIYTHFLCIRAMTLRARRTISCVYITVCVICREYMYIYHTRDIISYTYILRTHTHIYIYMYTRFMHQGHDAESAEDHFLRVYNTACDMLLLIKDIKLPKTVSVRSVYIYIYIYIYI